MVIPMKAVIGVGLLVSVCAFGQQAVEPSASSHQGPSSGLSSGYSGVNLFGGYSFTSIDTNGLGSRQSANGWEASVATRLIGPWAVEADGGGYYKTIDAGGTPLKLTDYSLMAGPRYNFPKGAFAHALVGLDQLQGSTPGFGSESQNGFAAALGGGVQIHVTRMVSFRTSADYVLTRHNIFTGGIRYPRRISVCRSVPCLLSAGGTPAQAMHDSSSKPNRHAAQQVPDWWTNQSGNPQK